MPSAFLLALLVLNAPLSLLAYGLLVVGRAVGGHIGMRIAALIALLAAACPASWLIACLIETVANDVPLLRYPDQ